MQLMHACTNTHLQAWFLSCTKHTLAELAVSLISPKAERTLKCGTVATVQVVGLNMWPAVPAGTERRIYLKKGNKTNESMNIKYKNQKKLFLKYDTQSFFKVVITSVMSWTIGKYIQTKLFQPAKKLQFLHFTLLTYLIIMNHVCGIIIISSSG